VKAVVRVSVAVLGLLGLAASQAPVPGTSPAPPSAPPGKDPLLEFVPSEHVPADSAVSFPVDI
jgi:hypothetical protein